MFGCEFRNGRAKSAPKLKEDPGAGGKALLKVAEDTNHPDDQETIHWDGRVFPVTEVEYPDGTRQLVPEALDHDEAVLPHLCQLLDSIFPKAVAVDADPEAEDATDAFEERGRELGRSLPPRRAARRAAADSEEASLLYV